MKLLSWFNDISWMLTMRRLRKEVQSLPISKRKAFFEAVRPSVERGGQIAWPDAALYITPDDIARALEAVGEPGHQAVPLYRPEKRKIGA